MTPKAFLDRAIAYWSFGWLSSDKLPEVAVEILELGVVSPSIIQLASADRVADPNLHRLFEDVLADLGRLRMTKPEAGRFIAQEYAEDICKGTITPVEGARTIWRVSLECEELGRELGIFGGRVTEYEGLPSGHDRISDMIVYEAKDLIEKSKGEKSKGTQLFSKKL